MKQNVTIFSDYIRGMRRFACGAVICAILGAVPAHAADNGCNAVGNDYIVPSLALCSTHVYNIGQVQNPTDDTVRQQMNQVVALKTTVIAQQMKKQYDYLEATIRRFDTQLDRAILTNRIRTATGASGDSDGGSSYGTGGLSVGADGKVGQHNTLAGARACDTLGDTTLVFDCLLSNYNLINSASNGGVNISSMELRNQLAKDFGFAYDYADSSVQKQISDEDNKNCRVARNLSKTQQFQTCLRGLINIVRRQRDEISKQNRTPNK